MLYKNKAKRIKKSIKICNYKIRKKHFLSIAKERIK